MRGDLCDHLPTVAADLQDIRRALDAIDAELVDVLGRRHQVEREVAALKAEQGLPVRDLARERGQLSRLEQLAHARDLDGYFVTRLFRQIIEQSVRFQQERAVALTGEPHGRPQPVTIAYQGTDGAYSQMAAEQHFGPRRVPLHTLGCHSFAEALQAVSQGVADYAMLPIENTTAGSINDAYDLLATTDLNVVGEEVLRVQHCLVALPGASLSGIRRVFSHPQGLAQCSEFLATLTDCHVESFTDTAMSVVKVRDDGDLSQAAVASERAADLYGLPILERDVANQKHNYTRFMVVARDSIDYPARLHCKTSLIFVTAHEEGALLRCLDELARRGLNLTKLESRPRAGAPFEYLFYLDFEGTRSDPRVQDALDALQSHTKFLKVLGSYPARTTRAGQPAEPERHRRRSTAAPDAPKHAAPPVAVSIGGHTLGEGRPLLVAGPALLGNRDHIVGCARAARRIGVEVLRGIYHAPPSAPGEYAGIGLAGLAELREIGHAHGLSLSTTVRRADEVARVAQQVDLLEVPAEVLGAQSLLDQVARIDRPALLWRAPDGDLEAWLAAAARVRAGGNQQVVLGLRATARHIDLSAIATANARTGLPVIVELGPLDAEGPRVLHAIADAALGLGAAGIAAGFDVDSVAPLRALCHHLEQA